MSEHLSARELEGFLRRLMESNFAPSASAGSELDLMVTRILLAPPGLVEEALSHEGFPAGEFVRALMARFIESREAYIKKIREKDGIFTIDISLGSAQAHFALIMGRLGIHGRLCEREVKTFLDSPDSWPPGWTATRAMPAWQTWPACPWEK